MHKPLVYMVKLKLLAQFPVDHLPHLIESSLVLFLRQFAAFAYHVIVRFVFITT